MTADDKPGLVARLAESKAPAATLLIRLMVGGVFLSEGIQKLVIPELRGAGRFAKIGLASPELLGPFVGATEIACGLLVLLGFLTRAAAVPLITIMLVALATTKLPTLLAEGFWTAAHASRTDLSMLLGSVFLLVVGSGPWALEKHWRKTS